ncbi:STAS domain-containing protein [Thermomonospora amylolytica]|uniref:STAS domain-containing protein n=1 Tax=Thermomonospora amylolytica TaxID=1411117 RepID=UPI000E6CEAC4|nr:STAS domain-containing protein [Thermomonospora amylolytica]
MRHQRRRQPQSARTHDAACPPALRVRVHRTGSDLLVQLKGEMCARTVEMVRAPLAAALRSAPAPRLLLDLSRVRLSDRFGLGLLVALRNATGRAGGRLILVRPAPDLQAMLADTGLDRHLQACVSLELAGTQVPISTRPGRLLPLRGPEPEALPVATPQEVAPDAGEA